MVMVKNEDLYVYMNGLHVGVLTWTNAANLIFIYDQSWLKSEVARPISLSMPLTEVPYKGQIVENFFDNLLPDNELIRERIQRRFHTASKRCFDLLSNIGADCVGALQLLPQSTAPNVKKITATPINKTEIAKLLKHYKTAPLGMGENLDFRISIAGAQEKTALLWHENKWQVPQQATPTSHIIKLPIGEIAHAGIDLHDSVENEWLCLKIMSAYGLSVNNAHIESFEDVKTLVVERFDRLWADDKSWLMRLPQEDFCQSLGKPSALKYESDGGPGIQPIMKLLEGSKNAIADRKRFMKSVFLFWVLGAIDGHAKNFSVKLEAGGRYELTPLYDVLSAYPIAAKRQLEWKAIKMAMSLKGKNRHYLWDNIQPRHWLAMASLCQFSEVEMQEIMDEACDKMEKVIADVEQHLPKGFPLKMCEDVFSGMRKIKQRCSK